MYPVKKVKATGSFLGMSTTLAKSKVSIVFKILVESLNIGV
jgi:hypothetical protein